MSRGVGQGGGRRASADGIAWSGRLLLTTLVAGGGGVLDGSTTMTWRWLTAAGGAWR